MLKFRSGNCDLVFVGKAFGVFCLPSGCAHTLDCDLYPRTGFAHKCMFGVFERNVSSGRIGMHIALDCRCLVRISEVDGEIYGWDAATMGTEKGSMAVADAIKDIELEKIRGPGDSTFVKLGSFWEDQVFAPVSNSVHPFFCTFDTRSQFRLRMLLNLIQRTRMFFSRVRNLLKVILMEIRV